MLKAARSFLITRKGRTFPNETDHGEKT
jgi:hypothetical protein